MSDVILQELIEEEIAIQRWVGEGGSTLDPFGILDAIHAKLERRRRASGAMRGSISATTGALVAEPVALSNRHRASKR